MIRKPSLFIIGAPKCGTSAISHWLSEHPDVYIPKLEPHRFYCPYGPPMTSQEYESLFVDAKDQRIIAEASAWYLFSPQALERIHEFNPEARIVVCLRNPADMAVSLHSQLLRAGRETVTSFEDAWNLRGPRKKGIPSGLLNMWRGDPKHTAYDLACQLGTQLERAYRIFPKEQIHTVLLDDIRDNPSVTWASLLAFLDIAQDDRQDFPVVNPAHGVRYKRLQQLIHNLRQKKSMLRIPFDLGILSRVHMWNLYERPACAAQEVRQMLTATFLDEIQLLERLLRRDLSSWYADGAKEQLGMTG